jgi:hypothetical protein
MSKVRATAPLERDPWRTTTLAGGGGAGVAVGRAVAVGTTVGWVVGLSVGFGVAVGLAVAGAVGLAVGVGKGEIVGQGDDETAVVGVTGQVGVGQVVDAVDGAAMGDRRIDDGRSERASADDDHEDEDCTGDTAKHANHPTHPGPRRGVPMAIGNQGRGRRPDRAPCSRPRLPGASRMAGEADRSYRALTR